MIRNYGSALPARVGPALAILGLHLAPVNARAGGSPTGTGTMKRTTLPSRDEIRPDAPLRLNIAASLAFPDGSMTASGLRREKARGRLVVERIAGKTILRWPTSNG